MSQFRDYVTSTAFSLSASRRQIECLSHIDQYGHTLVTLATFRALEHKGLVERKANQKPSDLDSYGTHIQLTEAGRAFIPLLKLAGVYVTLPARPEPETLPPIDVVVKPKQLPEMEEGEA